MLETVEVPAGADTDLVIAAHLDDANVLTCDDAYEWPTADTGAVDHLGRPIVVQSPGPPRLVRAGCWTIMPKGPKAGGKLVEQAISDHGHDRHESLRRHAERARRERPEPHVVLRGEGGIDAGRGRLSELRALHKAHIERGGRYDRPKPKPAKPKSLKPRGTVTLNGVDVPPGRVEIVGPWRVDTSDFDASGRPLVPGARVRLTSVAKP